VQVHRARNYLQTRDLNWAYSVDSAGASGREIFIAIFIALFKFSSAGGRDSSGSERRLGPPGDENVQ
jgi:hypothetical protein